MSVPFTDLRGWPATDDGLDVVCLLCLGRRGSCHVCQGVGRVMVKDLAAAARWVWAVEGCPCAACDRVRRRAA